MSLSQQPFGPAQIAVLREEVIRIASGDHAQWPQYAGHWDGPEWFLVRIIRPVKTKAGLAFAAGDITLAHFHRIDARDLAVVGPRPLSVIAYSVRNRIDTAVLARDVEQLG